jgi:hypothetical protein
MMADRARAAAAARDLLSTQNWTTAPVDPFDLARRLEVPVRAIDTTDFSGCLMRQGEQFAIFHSTAIDNEGFRRFTIGHELGHREMIHHHDHLFDAGGLHASRSNFVSNEWYEQEADAFSAELLMPEEMFRREMKKHGIGLAAIKSFAGTFQTSLTSTAIRYAQMTGDPVIVLVSEGGKILYNFRSECVQRFRPGFMARNAPVPVKSETGKLLRAGAPSNREKEGDSYLSAWFDGADDLKFYEDVIELGGYGKTLTVLHTLELPDREDPDEEEDDGGINPDGKRYRFR